MEPRVPEIKVVSAQVKHMFRVSFDSMCIKQRIKESNLWLNLDGHSKLKFLILFFSDLDINIQADCHVLPYSDVLRLPDY